MKTPAWWFWALLPVALLVALCLGLLGIASFGSGDIHTGTVLVAFFGTLFLSALALLLALPFALAIALVLGQQTPESIGRRWGEKWLRFQCALPSLAWAAMGFAVLSPIVLRWEAALGDRADGLGIIVAVPILAMCIIPRIGLSVLRILRTVPESLLQSAAALGASPRETYLHVILPHARERVLRLVLATFGKVTGEVVIVAMLLGYSGWWPESWFDSFPLLSQTLFAASQQSPGAVLSRDFAVMALIIILLTAILPAMAWREGELE